MAGGGRGIVGPESVDELVGGDSLARAQEQVGQQCALLRPSQRDRAAAGESFERAEEAELEALGGGRRGPLSVALSVH
jgi:hypothetical protein